MLRPGKDCRLHLPLGKPWKEALGSLEREGVSDDLWYWVGALDTGDVLLTALDTRPRMFAVIERAAKPTTSRSKWLDIDQFERFPLLVSVAAVEERMGGRMPRIPGPVPKDLTAALLDAVEAELTSRTPEVAREGRRCASSSRMRSTGLQAQALTASGGYCAACERDFGALLKGEGYAALEVHHRTPLADSPDEEVETTVDHLSSCAVRATTFCTAHPARPSRHCGTRGERHAPSATRTRRSGSFGVCPCKTLRRTFTWGDATCRPAHRNGTARPVSTSGRRRMSHHQSRSAMTFGFCFVATGPHRG